MSVRGDDYMETKKKAVRYYNDNQIPQHIETLLNSMFFQNPPDIYGYMSTHFAKLAKPPKICAIVCEPWMNVHGRANLNVGVSCCVQGVEKRALDMCSLFEDGPVKEEVTARQKSASEKAPSKATKKKVKERSSVDDLSQESLSVKPKREKVSFARVCEMFEQEFIPVLVSAESADQRHVDGLLQVLITEIVSRSSTLAVPTSDQAPPPAQYYNEEAEVSGVVAEVKESGSAQTISHDVVEVPKVQTTLEPTELYQSSMFSSLIVAATYAKVNEESLCSRLLRTLREGSDLTKLPVPALSLVTCDPASPGKLMMIKDILICPKSSVPLSESVKLLVKFSAALGQVLQGKFGGAGVVKNAEGRYTPPIDKIEQLFDLLNDAAMAVGADLAATFDLIVDVDAGHLYDEEKSKYEVALSGGVKTTDALIEMYKDWVENHPVVGIVDGVSVKDVEGMSTLFEMSDKCVLYTSATNQAHVSELFSLPTVNGVALKPEKIVPTLTQLSTLTETIRNIDSKASILISDDWCTVQNNTAAVDVAVALGASYICIGPCSAYQSLCRMLELVKEFAHLDVAVSQVEVVAEVEQLTEENTDTALVDR